MAHILTFESRLGLYQLRADGCRIRFNVSRDYFERLLYRYHRASVYKEHITTHDQSVLEATERQLERLAASHELNRQIRDDNISRYFENSLEREPWK